MLPLLVLIIVGFAVYWFIKTDTKDNKARKEAIQVEATIEKLRCKQRLKGDKSLVVVNYQGKSYSLFTTEKKCYNYKLNKTVIVYYSKTFDKLYLEK